MNYQIIQPAGLGDIFYCQKIAKELIRKGSTVFWPVVPPFSFLPQYIKFPGLHFYGSSDPVSPLDLQGALYPGTSIMGSKYKLAGMCGGDWLDYFTFDRNMEKEDNLYRGEVKSDKYCLISNTFVTPPNEVTLKIEPETDLPRVNIRSVEGYNPFDWCKIIENASEIHFVDTCFTYLVEKLGTRATKMVLYPREPYHKEIMTKEIWGKNWEYVNKNI